MKRTVKADGSSEAAWKRRRRQDVQQAVQSCEHLEHDPGDMAGMPEWSEWHQEELEFQKGKQERRLVEACQYDTLLDAEVSAELQQKVAARETANKKNDRTKIAERRRIESAKAKHHLDVPWSRLGQKFFLPDATTCAEHAVCIQLQRRNVQRTDDPWEADVLIVANAADPEERLLWIAVLMGKLLLDVGALQGSPHQRLLLQYKPATGDISPGELICRNFPVSSLPRYINLKFLLCLPRR